LVDIIKAAENIYQIDDRLYSLTGWGSVYLVDEDKKALIDTGPATSADAVLVGIKQAGIKPEDIDYIILTHIHLDHAGGAGVLVKHMPKAQVYVHSRGVKNIINPEKLMASTIAFQGAEALQRNGEAVAIPEDRVKAVADGEELKLSDKQTLKFIDAPGHAPHELSILETRNNGLFVGDTVGLCMPKHNILFPITSPPSYDSEQFLATLQKLAALKVSRLYFAHFGVCAKAADALKKSIDTIRTWDKLAETALKRNGLDGLETDLIGRVHKELAPLKKESEAVYNYATEMSIKVGVAGYMKYQRDKKEAEKRRNSESNQGKN
jgi:glyoxylase-like metal-dependent hydrolase (beta-lactamase superfamily II)